MSPGGNPLLTALSGRLRERRPELERAVLQQANALSDAAEVEDPEYRSGLRSAVSAAVGYGIAAVDSVAPQPASPPEPLLLQARLAARNDVALDVVLRRYLAGYALLSGCLLEEAEDLGSISTTELRWLLGREAMLLDSLVASVSEAYASADAHQSAERRRAELVRRMLAGEQVDPLELGYDLDVWHVGVLATGSGAPQAIRDLAAALDRRLLMVRTAPSKVWAWMGGRRRVSAREVLRLAETYVPARSHFGLGEAGLGVEGWRRTHLQAKAALSIAMRRAPGTTAYADIALLAAALGDEVLVGSFRDTYLSPLEREADGGEALRATLNAYFEAGCQVSSTAIALGVSRQTVSARLRKVEEKIERPVEACSAELKLALRLNEFVTLPRAIR